MPTVANDLITEIELRSMLRYEPDTGKFYWLVYRGPTAKAGCIAGCLNVNGYINIKIAGTGYKAHRLAWLYQHGQWPQGFIDHIDGDRSNNRIANLRDVEWHVNYENRAFKTKGKSGLLGVSFRADSNSYRARICVGYKRINLGQFDTPEEAHAAYLEAKKLHHTGGTDRLNQPAQVTVWP